MRFISTFGFKIAMLAICAISSSQSAYCTINSKWYIQDGLVAHWDAIDNAGVGQHDPNAMVWKDLVKGTEIKLDGHAVLRDDFGVLVTNTTTFSGLTELVTLDPITLELCSNCLAPVPSGSTTVGKAINVLHLTQRAGMSYETRYPNSTFELFTLTGNDYGKCYYDNVNIGTSNYSVMNSIHTYAGVCAKNKSITPYYDGVRRQVAAKLHWNNSDTSAPTGDGKLYSSTYSNVFYSVRFYNRQLSDAEFAYNAALDRVRYLGGTLAEELPETLPSKYRYNSESGTIECAHTIDFDASKCSVTVDSTVYSESAQLWLPIGISTNLTITVNPAPGYEFLRWEGKVPNEDKSKNPLQLRIDGSQHSLNIVFAKIKYVASDATGDNTGEDWANAYTNIQDAIDAVDSESVVKIKSGTYFLTNQLNVASGSRINLRGGYDVIDGVEKRTSVPSEIVPAEGVSCRLLYANSVTDLKLDTLKFAGGRIGNTTANTYCGAGLYLVSSTVAITNCVVTNCHTKAKNYAYGGGVYASGSSLDIRNSCIFDNHTRAIESYSEGAGIYTKEAVNTVISNCVFKRNWTCEQYYNGYGGGLFVSGGNADVSDCHFVSNMVSGSNSYGNSYTRGSAIFLGSSGNLKIKNCLFKYNVAHGRSGAGVVCVNSGTGVADISYSIFVNNRYTGWEPNKGYNNNFLVDDTYVYGGIGTYGGTVNLKHVLIADGVKTTPVRSNGGKITLDRVTIANCAAKPFHVVSGSINVSRSVIDTESEVLYTMDAGTFNAEYSCVPSREGLTGLGNFVADPLLADDSYYHPLSRAGYYTGGFFSGGRWTASTTETCPTIDAGLNRDFYLEPEPNALLENLGYDAGTPVASKSDLGNPPVPDSLAVWTMTPSNTAEETAFARGVVPDFGQTEKVDVTLYWGDSDGGTTDAANWQNSLQLGQFEAYEYFSAFITNAAYRTYYRLTATDAAGNVAWSDPVEEYVAIKYAKLADEIQISHVYRNSARLTINVDDGGAQTHIKAYCWVDGTAVTSVVEIAEVNSGIYMINFKGLMTGAMHYYKLEFTNDAGLNTVLGSLTTMGAEGSVFYATPEGAGIQDGSSWENAFSHLQDAFDVATGDGDIIYLKYGDYKTTQPDINEPSQFLISNAAGLTIKGGYLGVGAPGERGDARSRIARESSRYRRALRVTDSKIAFDKVDVVDARHPNVPEKNAGGFYGLGVWFENSDAEINSCIFSNNVGDTTSTKRCYYGGAIAHTGTGRILKITDSIFIDNKVSARSDNDFTYGAAIYAKSTQLMEISQSLFVNNLSESSYHNSYGGAIDAEGLNKLKITDSQFRNNRVVKSATHQTTYAYGGAIFSTAKEAEFVNCEFSGNYTIGPAGKGGVLYLNGKCSLNDCVFLDNGKDTTACLSSIILIDGSIAATNVLYANNKIANAFDIIKGKAEFVNCTIAGAVGYGIARTGGDVSLVNSIIWGNGAGGVNGSSITATYCCTQEPMEGDGNFSENPRFKDPANGNYQLTSASPCKNRGTKLNWTKADSDLNKQMRVRGGVVDLGPYEYQNDGFFIHIR